MIKISINKKDEQINLIKIEGHAGYSKYGKDIVCAAVSSIVTTTVNGLSRLDNECLSYIEDDGMLSITILKHDNIIDVLLENMIELLKELERNYKKYIKIEN